MKLVIRVQLIPEADQAANLKATMERFNEAANWTAGELHREGVTNKRAAQKLVYRGLRDRFGLTAQTAILVIHRACEAYKRDKTIRPEFREHAAITYDPRVLRFIGLDRVNLWTLAGRIVVPIVMGKYQAERMDAAKGQCDLMLRKGKWFLIVTVDVPDRAPIEAEDFLGVDLGLARIATDSDGNAHSGKPVDDVRRKHNLQRKRLGKKNTKGAKKKLKRIAGKEARFRKAENHRISKEIVATAKGTSRGIAVEDLSGIRERLPAWGRDARNRLGGWGFRELRSFLEYKAKLAGVFVVAVGPRNTSRTCSACGHCEKDVCWETCHRIPHSMRRFSGSEPGPSDLPTAERHGGPQHVGEAGAGDVSKPNAPQGPRGKVKAKLPQVQSRSGYSQPLRYADSSRSLRMTGTLALCPPNPYGEIPEDDSGRRDEWTT